MSAILVLVAYLDPDAFPWTLTADGAGFPVGGRVVLVQVRAFDGALLVAADPPADGYFVVEFEPVLVAGEASWVSSATSTATGSAIRVSRPGGWPLWPAWRLRAIHSFSVARPRVSDPGHAVQGGSGPWSPR